MDPSAGCALADYDEPRSMKKLGKVENIFLVSRGLVDRDKREFYVRRYINYWDLLWMCYFCPR